jgi:hypothetical protein
MTDETGNERNDGRQEQDFFLRCRCVQTGSEANQPSVRSNAWRLASMTSYTPQYLRHRDKFPFLTAIEEPQMCVVSVRASFP